MSKRKSKEILKGAKRKRLPKPTNVKYAVLPFPLRDAIDKYSQWSRDYLNREEAENQITETLYQYTDARGLRGIFESEQIWFTDYRHLNDPSELLHGMETARDIARRHRPRADRRARVFLDFFIEKFKPDNFDLEFYIASFSRARDDLGQWRAYADNGRGFAIGFSPRLFKMIKKPKAGNAPDFVGSVKYTRDDVYALYTPPILEAAQRFLSEAITNAKLVSLHSGFDSLSVT